MAAAPPGGGGVTAPVASAAAAGNGGKVSPAAAASSSAPRAIAASPPSVGRASSITRASVTSPPGIRRTSSFTSLLNVGGSSRCECESRGGSSAGAAAAAGAGGGAGAGASCTTSSSAPFASACIRLGSRYQLDPEQMPPYAPRLALPPPAPPPLCDCGAPSVWLRRRWLCARQGRGGCELRLSSDEERPCPDRADVLTSHSHLEPRQTAEGLGPRGVNVNHAEGLGPRQADAADAFVSVARGTAALLTACAYGPVNEWAFVGPSSAANTHRAPMTFGLGLFARVPLRAGQVRPPSKCSST